MYDATGISDDDSVERYGATSAFRRELPEAKTVAASGAKRLFDIVAAASALLDL